MSKKNGRSKSKAVKEIREGVEDPKAEAAMEGMGITLSVGGMYTNQDQATKMEESFTYLLNSVSVEDRPLAIRENYPNHPYFKLWSIIAVLNNNYGWTRDEIAAYVETLEKKYGWEGSKEVEKNQVPQDKAKV